MVRMSKMLKILTIKVLFVIFSGSHNSNGHELVVEGLVKFEKVCSEVGAGELPQLLHYLKSTTTLTPTATPKTPVKQEVKEEEEEMDMGIKTEVINKPIIEKPVTSVWGRTVEYRCANCNITPTRSKASMDAHIRSVHTKKALLCSFCPFSTYNSEQAHEEA